MNIKREIVAIALNKAGEEPLNDEEFEQKKGPRWNIAKDFYKAVILETLANTEWTSQKKRAALVLSEDENLSNYMFMYELPIDCAKAVELKNEEEYLIENNKLYTDAPDAVLIYVSNGYTGRNKYTEASPQPTVETFTTGTYYNYNEETDTYELSQLFTDGVTYYVLVEEDYPLYDNPKLDPLLEEYIETKLAANIALKLTGDQQKYQMLFNEATLVENRAIKASMAHGHNKDSGNEWWGKTLGLPDYGVENADY